MNPQDYAQQKAAASGSSFYYAFLFLPPERRAAITAFYAFCREVDDVVDEVQDAGVAQTKLAWWRQEVAQAFAGRPSHPATQALIPHCATYDIEARQLLAVIDGCQMDLDQNRYLDFASLRRYCHLVAGVVGEVAARIFGQTQAATTGYAHRLGLAFQLTNIIRDVGEDAVRGRIYLPVDELQRFDLKAHELLRRGPAPGGDPADFERRFRALMAFQCERALQTYAEALAQLPPQDRQAQKPGLMMASIYRTLLREIAADPMLVLTRRVSLTPLRKFWLAWKVQALGRL
ncbi:MAG: squalene synthase HpnD [Burkholderiales bacterium]|nr:MAG: squalene synthase HpnD [Burkholderiales bacterium]